MTKLPTLPPAAPDIADLLRQALAGLLPAGIGLEALLDRVEGRA